MKLSPKTMLIMAVVSIIAGVFTVIDGVDGVIKAKADEQNEITE